MQLSPLIQQKIQLFTSLFKWRTDIYAKRWESNKTWKSGYTPACKNEFDKIKCNKFKIKCSNCLNRELLPLTEDVILKHLTGQITIGIYPLLQGDLCHFLAIDFDKKTFEKDVIAFWDTCNELNIPMYVEKSRSGNWAHIWIFFSEKILAKNARKLWTILLTKTMDKMSISMSSYDRLFPNQDTMPNWWFWNLIALPFQGKSSKDWNTLFVNEYFEPLENQQEILANVKRLNNNDILEFLRKNDDDFVEEEEILDEDEIPKRKIPKEIIFINNVECIFDNQIYIKKLKLLPNEVSYLKRLASFTNPVFFEKQKFRMPVYNTPRIITCFEEDSRFLILPRWCLDDIQNTCNKSNVKLIIKDTREKWIEIDFKFAWKLDEKQELAKKELLKYDFWILSATTGFWKTVIWASIISDLKINTLVVVHTRQLLKQWKERLSTFLWVNKREIWQIWDGKEKPNWKLDVAILQSLYKKDNINEVVENYWLVIVDECHHISAFSFEQVLKAVRAKYVYWLTATPIRKDGHHPIIFMQCWNIRYKVNAKQIKNDIEKVVIFKETFYKFQNFESTEKFLITDIYNDMVYNETRNNLIVSDITEIVKEGRIPIILSERVEHLNILKEKLNNLDIPIIIYKSWITKKEDLENKKILEEADKNEIPRIILWTSKLIWEGFDDDRLDTLFLTMPVSWKGRISQYVGRLHRDYKGKNKVMVYDYVDNMKMLENMCEKRKKAYKSLGYEF